MDLIDHGVGELDTAAGGRVLAVEGAEHAEALALDVEVERLARVADLTLEVEDVLALLARLEAEGDLLRGVGRQGAAQRLDHHHGRARLVVARGVLEGERERPRLLVDQVHQFAAFAADQ